MNKPGKQTSEFYLSIASILSLLLSNQFGVDLPVESIAISITTIVAVYIAGRSYLKGRIFKDGTKH